MEIELSEIDFRFADDEDAEDIAVVVNRSYANEVEGPHSFRKPGPRIDTAEIISDFSTASVRWIILETPRPEELVIAAIRLRIVRESTTWAVIDVIGSAESKAIRNMLLNRAEAICQSLGCAKVVIEAPSWSEPLQEWLSECGYEDLGGHMWPEEKDYMLLKPTLVMEFQKQLCPSEDTVLSAEPSSTVSTAGSAESHIGAEGSLNELLAELLGALRAEAENAPVPQAPIASSSEAAHLDSPSNGSVTDVIGALDGIHIDTVNCGGEGVSFSLCDTNSAVESEAASDSNRTDLGDDAMKGIISDLFKALHAEAVPADPDV